MNAISAIQCLWFHHVIKKNLKLDCFLAKVRATKTYKMCITAILTHFVLKLYKNKNLRCYFKKLGLMLQTRTNYTAFVARQRCHRAIFVMVLKWSLHHH